MDGTLKVFSSVRLSQKNRYRQDAYNWHTMDALGRELAVLQGDARLFGVPSLKSSTNYLFTPFLVILDRVHDQGIQAPQRKFAFPTDTVNLLAQKSSSIFIKQLSTSGTVLIYLHGKNSSLQLLNSMRTNWRIHKVSLISHQTLNLFTNHFQFS